MRCPYCDEDVFAADDRVSMPHVDVDDGGPVVRLQWFHRACQTRMIVGGIGHQQGSCSCSGRADGWEDPPGMTRREAAIAAHDFFMAMAAARIGQLVGITRGDGECN